MNCATDHSRRRGALRRALRRFAASETLATVPSYPSDLDELYALPPRERAAIYLFEVEGYRYGEIARMLGCSEAAAKKGASRARRRLVAALSEEVSP